MNNQKRLLGKTYALAGAAVVIALREDTLLFLEKHLRIAVLLLSCS
jgi:hypothetical protein